MTHTSSTVYCYGTTTNHHSILRSGLQFQECLGIRGRVAEERDQRRSRGRSRGREIQRGGVQFMVNRHLPTYALQLLKPLLTNRAGTRQTPENAFLAADWSSSSPLGSRNPCWMSPHPSHFTPLLARRRLLLLLHDIGRPGSRPCELHFAKFMGAHLKLCELSATTSV